MRNVVSKRFMVVTGCPGRPAYYTQNFLTDHGATKGGTLGGGTTGASGTLTVDLQPTPQVEHLTITGDIQSTDIVGVQDAFSNFSSEVIGATKDEYSALVTNTTADGQVALTIGTNVYTYTVQVLDSDTDVAAGVVALAVADPEYDVTNTLGALSILAKVTGPTSTSVVIGASGSTHIDSGHVNVGTAADTLNDLATRLAALINASPLYSATATLNVITVVGEDPAVPYFFSDTSNNNDSSGVTLAVADVVVTPVGSNFSTDPTDLTLGDYVLRNGVHYAVVPLSVNDTAANLAAAINALPGFSAVAAGADVTITGPTGPYPVAFAVKPYGTKVNLTANPPSGFLTVGGPVKQGITLLP